MKFFTAFIVLAFTASSSVLAIPTGVTDEGIIVRSNSDVGARAIEPIDIDARDIEDLDAREIEDLEARKGGGGGGLDAAGVLVDLVTGAINIVNQNKEARDRFASSVVGEMQKKAPGWNYVACHVKHRYNFKGTRGKDWMHTHKEFQYHMGGTTGYEIYQFKEGEFWREGDGGFLNWAFIGNVKTRDQNGAHLVFGKP